MSAQQKERGSQLESSRDKLGFDPKTGKLVSFRAKTIPDQELVEVGEQDPVFVIQYLDEDQRFGQITSQQAEEIEIKCEHRSSEEIGKSKVNEASTPRVGLVFANWTTQIQQVHITDERLGDKALESVSSDNLKSRVLSSVDGGFRIALPGLSCVLLECPE